MTRVTIWKIKWYDKYFSNVTETSQWPPWRLKSLVCRLFAQLFVQVHTKENIKFRATGLCDGNLLVNGGFAQSTSNAETVSIRWRHHERRNICNRDDVRTWKWFHHHLWADALQRWPVMRSINNLFVVKLNKLLNKFISELRCHYVHVPLFWYG